MTAAQRIAAHIKADFEELAAQRSPDPLPDTSQPTWSALFDAIAITIARETGART